MLEELHLDNVGLTADTLATLGSDASTDDQAATLVDLFSHGNCSLVRSLRVLSLASNMLTGIFQTGVSVNAGELHGGFDVDCSSLKALGHALPDGVESLDLHGCHLGSGAARAISAWPRLLSLRFFDLSGDRDGGLVGGQHGPDNGLEEWREFCGWLGQQTTIEGCALSLSLAANGIGPQALSIFVTHALGPNLRAISLRGNPMCTQTDDPLESWTQFCDAIAFLQLETLDLANIAFIASDQQRIALLHSLTMALSDSALQETLCTLDVSSNGLSSDDKDGKNYENSAAWMMFAAALQRCTKLQTLRLSSNGINALATKQLLLQSLWGNGSDHTLSDVWDSLSELDLGSNPLECGGMRTLAQFLPHSRIHMLTVHMGVSQREARSQAPLRGSQLVTLKASMSVLDLSSWGLRGYGT